MNTKYDEKEMPKSAGAASLPTTSWSPLIDNLGYSVGFLIVVLGRQQLFTENTLTAMLPVLAHPNVPTILRML